MQKWDGRVVESHDEYFTAELVPTDDSPTVHADFERFLLGPDSDAVDVGDMVYVTVRTVRGHAGQTSRTAAIRLRRTGQWSEHEVASIWARAEEMGREIAAYIE